MAQVTEHEVLGNGDHKLTLDDGSTVTVAGADVPVGASWGDVLRTAGAHEGDPKAIDALERDKA